MLIKMKGGGGFVSGSAIYLISNILNASIPFILLPILTRYLTPAEYGQIAMFQALIGALAAFVGLNVVAAAGRKYYDSQLGFDELAQFVGVCLQIILFTSVIVLYVVWVFRGSVSDWLGLEVKWLLLAVFITAGSMVIRLRLGQWQVRKKAVPYGVLQVSQSLVNMLLSLLCVVVLLQGAPGRMAAQGYTTALFTVLAIWLLWNANLLKVFIWRLDLIKEALRFGLPLIPHVAGIYLLVTVDRFFINAELGLEDAGIYMVAVQVAAGLALVFDAINKAYVPWLFEQLKRDSVEQKIRIVRYTYGWYFLLLLASALGFVIGPWLMAAVVGDAYLKASEVVGWLILGQIFGGMYQMLTSYVFYSKRTGLLSLTTIISGLVNVVLLLFLIRYIGLKGAAYAFVIAMALRFLLTWYVAQQRHPMPWFDSRVWGRS